MIIPKALLDTDTISTLTRKRRYERHPNIIARASAYEATYGGFTISIITRYEVMRGLKAKGSAAQVSGFEQFCQSNEVLALTDEIVVRGTDIYADLKRRGELIGDIDILIAATALV
ncbi:MAG TPA: PIN domain-containing protein, partial [Chloroflexia bacterium]|nr:PIN domain-containing protein [Chloroflexia bacterium]